MLIKKIVVASFLICAGLIYFVFSTKEATQQIKVNLTWHDKRLHCQSTFDPNNKGEAWFIEQLQFFLSDIDIKGVDNVWQRLKLLDNPYQTSGTVLLGTNCRHSKTQRHLEKQSHWLITFEHFIDIAKVKTLRFTLGVPFESNHVNPVTQKSPLNVPSMFWVWQTGHKFLRAELASANKQWLFHLGSTGCKANSVMRAPKQACRYPNVFEFEVPVNEKDGDVLTLNVDLAKLLKHVELTQKASCQSELNNENCQQLFDNLSSAKKALKSVDDKRIFSAAKVVNTVEGTELE